MRECSGRTGPSPAAAWEALVGDRTSGVAGGKDSCKGLIPDGRLECSPLPLGGEEVDTELLPLLRWCLLL